MPLKRKRPSPSALSPSTSTTNSSTSRSTSPLPTSHADIPMTDTPPTSSIPQSPPSPSHLDSRTRKRFRDNRPDEDTVYANTYATLFAAAARSPNPAPSPAPPPPASSRSAVPQQREREREGSLHNHWHISTPPPPPPPHHAPIPHGSPAARCEDCDNALYPTHGDGGADVVMGGMEGEAEYTCGSCGKRVCDACAVVAVGVGRDCLGCKTRRGVKWVGGIGWCP